MRLELKNVCKSFSEKAVIKNLSYTFEGPGLYALVGESGAGKTTLLRIISGLDKEFSGEIISSEKNVSYAFQEYRLFPALSAFDNLLHICFDSPTDSDKREVYTLLSTLGFSESDMHLLPAELSGGMKQRVSFARAVIKKSPILLLDEPTKELDDANRETILNIIRGEAKKRLVIIVSHNFADIVGLNAKILGI